MYIINILEIYKKIDGSMHPEFNNDKLKELESKEGSQQPKEDSKQSLWNIFSKGGETVANFFKNRPTSSDDSGIKSLPIVKTYLEPYYKFITGEIGLNLNLIEAADEIVYTIESLIKSYFHVDNSHRCLLASYVKKVKSIHVKYRVRVKLKYKKVQRRLSSICYINSSVFDISILFFYSNEAIHHRKVLDDSYFQLTTFS